MRLELCGHHELAKSLFFAQAVQIEIADLLGTQMTKFSLVNVWISAVKERGHGILEKRVTNGF